MIYPTFIIVHNQLTFLDGLVSWLEKVGHAERIYLVDNDSTYPPLLEYFERTPHQVIHTGYNYEHTLCWTRGILANHLLSTDEHFIVSDPDIIPTEECPDDAIELMRSLLDKDPTVRKAGFSLKIDDLPEHYHLRDQAIRHESQFWETYDPAIGAYRSPLDMTFSLYPRWAAAGHDIWNALRTPEPYVARHMTWYLDRDNETEEERYMREHVNTAFTHWAGH